MSKEGKIVLVVILSILACTLIGMMIFLIKNSSNFNFGINIGNSNLSLVDSVEEKYDVINNISLDLNSSDIEIKKSEDNNIKVEYFSNSDENPKIEKKDGTIKINENEDRKVNVGIFNNRSKVIVYVPSEYVGAYNIIVKSGDICSEVDSYNNKTNIQTASGDVKLIAIGEGSITTTSGDIKIDKISKVIKIHTISGDVKIEDLDIKENSEIEVTSGDVTINNNVCNCYIDASTISGDKLINCSDRKSEIELKIKTTSGDIRVN